MKMLALLFLVATQVMAAEPVNTIPSPDFVIDIMGNQTPIYCSSNKTNIAVYEEMRDEVVGRITPLEQARLSETIDEDQSQELFAAELERAVLSHIVARYQRAAYFCEHKDKLSAAEKPKEK